MYSIYIRDENLRRVGQITDFTKLDLIPRFNAVGAFSLDVPTFSYATGELIKDKYGIIIKRDGKELFSGTVDGRSRKCDSSGDVMTFIGIDDNNFLASRLAYPVPIGDFSQKDYDVRSGSAESVIKQYVNYNAGPNAKDERQILTIEPDAAMGSMVQYSARFENLLDLAASLSISGGGLGFKVVQVNGSLQFQVYQPTDKTKTVFFSMLLGNLGSFDYSNNNPESNYALVGGGGEGNLRMIREKGDAASISKYGRFESFIDKRNTTDETELSQALDEELANKGEKNSFNFIPIDTPRQQFGKDYGLGDKVSIVITQPDNTGQQKLAVIQDIVREVKISITPNDVSISPVVGTQESNSSSVLGIFDKVRKLDKRLGNLERV